MDERTWITDEVVERAAAGAERERSVLFQALYPRLRAWAFESLAPSPRRDASAEEIAQVAAADVARALPALRVRDAKTLLRLALTIVSRRSADHREDCGRRWARSLDSGLVDASHSAVLGDVIPASGTSPSAAVERSESLELLRRAMALLSPAARGALELRLGGFSAQETALILGISKDAVLMRIARATKDLRTILRGGQGEGDATDETTG